MELKIFEKTVSTYLHEEATDEGLSDVDVVILGGEFCRGSFQIETIHDARQLLPHIVSRLKRAVVDKIVITPLRVFHV